MESSYIYTIDVAHPPLSAQAAEQILDDTLQMIRMSPKYRVLKVIHGKGTIEKPGILKSVVQNWAYRNRQHLKAWIPGEQYSLFDPKTQEMRSICGQVKDRDLGASNTGITVFWVR